MASTTSKRAQYVEDLRGEYISIRREMLLSEKLLHEIRMFGWPTSITLAGLARSHVFPDGEGGLLACVAASAVLLLCTIYNISIVRSVVDHAGYCLALERESTGLRWEKGVQVRRAVVGDTLSGRLRSLGIELGGFVVVSGCIVAAALWSRSANTRVDNVLAGLWILFLTVASGCLAYSLLNLNGKRLATLINLEADTWEEHLKELS